MQDFNFYRFDLKLDGILNSIRTENDGTYPTKVSDKIYTDTLQIIDEMSDVWDQLVKEIRETKVDLTQFNNNYRIDKSISVGFLREFSQSIVHLVESNKQLLLSFGSDIMSDDDRRIRTVSIHVDQACFKIGDSRQLQYDEYTVLELLPELAGTLDTQPFKFIYTDIEKFIDVLFRQIGSIKDITFLPLKLNDDLSIDTYKLKEDNKFVLVTGLFLLYTQLYYLYDLRFYLQQFINEKSKSTLFSNEGLVDYPVFESADIHSYSTEGLFNKKKETAKDKMNSGKTNAEKILQTTLKYGRMRDDISTRMEKFNILRTSFYKRNIGKIQSAYELYGSEATITESEAHGDIVDLFINGVPALLKAISQNLNTMYDKFIKMMVSVEHLENDEAIDVINKWTEKYDVPKDKPNLVKKYVLNELNYQFAKVLLKDVTVYGYTVTSITENGKLPPIKSLLSSVIIKDIMSHPKPRPVNELIRKQESFEMMYYEMRSVVRKVADNIGGNLIKDLKDKSTQFKVLKTDYKDTRLQLKQNDKTKGLVGGKSRIDKLKDVVHTDKQKSGKIYKSLLQTSNRFLTFYGYVGGSVNATFTLGKKIDNTVRKGMLNLINYHMIHDKSRVHAKINLKHKDVTKAYKGRPNTSRDYKVKMAAAKLKL